MDKKVISKVDLERAERIRDMRKSQNMTQEKMAERMDISIASYQRLESGRNNITLEYLTKIKQEFGVSSDYILFGETNGKKDMELQFDSMSDGDKLSMFIRLMAHISSVKSIDYEKLLVDINKYIR